MLSGVWYTAWLDDQVYVLRRDGRPWGRGAVTS